MRPRVIRSAEEERLRLLVLHQPWDEGLDLLVGHRANVEEVPVADPALVVRGVDEDRLRGIGGGERDSPAFGARKRADDQIDLVVVDQLLRLLNRGVGIRGGVFEEKLDLRADHSAMSIHVVDRHLRIVFHGWPQHGQEARQGYEGTHLDGTSRGCRLAAATRFEKHDRRG